MGQLSRYSKAHPRDPLVGAARAAAARGWLHRKGLALGSYSPGIAERVHLHI